MEQQLDLPLNTDPGVEQALHDAWQASGTGIPFRMALETPAIAFCLRQIAAAERRRRGYA